MKFHTKHTVNDQVHRAAASRLAAQVRFELRSHLPLLMLGIALEILLLAMYSTTPDLNWYPSRLGPVAEWLDHHLYAPIRPLLSDADGIYRIMPVVTYFLALAAMFGVYILAMRHAARRGTGNLVSFYIVLGFSAVFAISALWQPYLSSQDIFSYAFYAHISALYGGNPYVAVPRDFPFDPLFSAIFWKDQPSNYGPVWTYLTAFVTLLTGTNTALTLVAIKLIVTIFALAGIPLVWQILGQVSPKMRLTGTLLYAWNPLLILETAGSGHNDSVVGFFVLLGLYLYARNARLGGFSALVLSVFTKYVTAALLPLYLILWLRDSTGKKERCLILIKVTAITGALAAISYLPVYAGPATFQVAVFGTNPSAYINSPLELAFREIRVLLGDSRDVASLPLRYRAWWVTTNTATSLWSRPDAGDSSSVGLPASTALMVVEPPRGTWLHVYAPRLDRFGYVREASTAPTAAPDFVGGAGATTALLQASNPGTNSQQANLILRVATGTLFASLLFYLVRKTKSYKSLIYAALVTLFASYWLLQTWFWPWYLIWALPLAALAPNNRIAALMVAFCLTALGVHAQVDISVLPYIDAAYEYRSLAIFGLPLLLVGASLATSFLRCGRLPTTALALANSLARLYRRSARGASASTRQTRAQTFIGRASKARISQGAVVSSGVVLLVFLALGFTNSTRQGPEDLQPLAKSPVESDGYSLDWVEDYWQGVELFETNQYPRAVASLSRAIEARPDFTNAYRLRFVAFLQMRKFDRAIEDISTVLAAEGDDLDLLLARGSAYQQTQRSGLALQDFARAILIAPRDHRAYRYRAQTYHELGLINEAIASQQQALALSPYSAVLYRELASMHATLGLFEDALMLYNAAISLDRNDVESYAGRASILRILGRGEETIPDLREVLVLSNDEDLRTWAQRTMAAVSGADNNDQPGTEPK